MGKRKYEHIMNEPNKKRKIQKISIEILKILIISTIIICNQLLYLIQKPKKKYIKQVLNRKKNIRTQKKKYNISERVYTENSILEFDIYQMTNLFSDYFENIYLKIKNKLNLTYNFKQNNNIKNNKFPGR
jgi:hypothetical protein